jgi:catechol 2,3-dioxygenase-like lactoylglutathione lyase family enzyme
MPSIQRLQHASVPMPPDGHTAARAFYGGVLGMEEVPPPSTLSGMSLVWFRTGDTGDEVHCFAEEALGPNSPNQHICLQADDLAGIRQRLIDHGATVEETIAIPNRPRFFTHDPFGNRIEITQIVGDYR